MCCRGKIGVTVTWGKNTINLLRCNRLPILVGVFLKVASGTVAAQDTIHWPRADRLQVSVNANLVRRSGDSLDIIYVIHNEVSSLQAAAMLAIRTFTTDYVLTAPRGWDSYGGMVQDSAAAGWFSLSEDSDVLVGTSKASFEFTGTGIMQVVPFRVEGRIVVPSGVEETGDVVERPPSFWENSAAGFTVGVLPLNANETSVTLLGRIHASLERSCDISWITDSGICNSLSTKLEQAGRALEAGNNETTSGQLRNFLEELENEHGEEPGEHVSDNAYWLLKVNVEFILERMAAGEA